MGRNKMKDFTVELLKAGFTSRERGNPGNLLELTIGDTYCVNVDDIRVFVFKLDSPELNEWKEFIKGMREESKGG
jgi:hypothetical protein